VCEMRRGVRATQRNDRRVESSIGYSVMSDSL
jgi:hypothetical protein